MSFRTHDILDLNTHQDENIKWVHRISFNLVTWPGMVNFTEINLNKICILNFSLISYQWYKTRDNKGN